MSILDRCRPCSRPGCKLPVLLDNDAWHVKIRDDGSPFLTVAHDTTSEDDIDEEIEQYD